MDLEASQLRQLENPNLSLDGKAELRCQLARELEDKGNYEDARQIMGKLWRHIAERPKIEKLEPSTAAEVLLRAGVLTGWIGSKNEVRDAQETAKNLISESLTIFEALGYLKKVLEVQNELALCYWREGRYDEARIIVQGILERLTTDSELKARAILRWAIIERESARYDEALHILIGHAPLFEKVNNHTVKGGYHATLADVLENLGETAKRGDYIDRAFVEYAAAGYHFEVAGHKCFRANVENNLGYLHFKARRYKEAHQHLNRARRIVVSLKDNATLAQYDETRARVFLAEGRNAEAEKAARWAVCTLERSDRQSLIVEALLTHGKALARLGYYNQSLSAFRRAIHIDQQMGMLTRAGETALTMVEELDEHLTSDEIQSTVLGSALGDGRLLYERNLIKQSLVKAEGSITHAARLLGITHQSLGYMLKTRHKDLISARTPAKQRRKSR
jgi:tetratricopeptide (TPR) repeat protein